MLLRGLLSGPIHLLWPPFFSKVLYPGVSHQWVSTYFHVLLKFTFLTPPTTPSYPDYGMVAQAKDGQILSRAWLFTIWMRIKSIFKLHNFLLNTCKEICREVQIVVDPPKICLKPLWIVRRGDENDLLVNLVELEPERGKSFGLYPTFNKAVQQMYKNKNTKCPIDSHCLMPSLLQKIS